MTVARSRSALEKITLGEVRARSPAASAARLLRRYRCSALQPYFCCTAPLFLIGNTGTGA